MLRVARLALQALILFALYIAFVAACIWAYDALTGKAYAHDSWISRGSYRNTANEWCCGDGDCGVLVLGNVTARPDGYHVDGVFRIFIGSSFTDERVIETIPFSEAIPSPDGAYWRCRWGGKRRCFFAPPPST